MGKAADVVRSLDDAAEDDGDAVRLSTINCEAGHRSLGAFIALPAALELTPIGGIPGVPTVIALIVAVFAVQIALGRDEMWLPGWLGRRTVKAERLDRAAEKMRPWAERADRHFGNRLHWLVDPPAPRIAAGAILLLCLTIPPLELVPFASSIPTSVMVLFGVAMILRDGLVMALAWAGFVAAAIGLWFVVPF